SVKALAAGYYHSLALKEDGTVWAFGFNNSGQLGLGDTTNRFSPVQVTALGSSVKALTAGAWHSLSLQETGTVWAWGRNDYGQLGLGDTTNCSSPVQVTTLGNNVEALAGGGVHTLALKRDGTVWAWGGNTFGQLGLGDATDRSSPVQVTFSAQYNQTLFSGWNMVTVGVQTLQSPAQLFGPGFKSIYRWEPIGGSYFTPQALEPGLGYWVKMAAAATITVQGIPVFSLTLPLSPGWNQVGSPFASSTPWSSVKVVKDAIEYTMSVAKVAGWIAAGYSWNGISYDAIDYASGSMGVGQGFWLKDNTVGVSLLYRNPVSPKPSIVAGGIHTLALQGDGTVWAWGLNSSGQLGLGDTTNRSSPVQVTALGSIVKALAAGYYHSLALKEDGTVWAWGYNIHGQLGLGDFADRNNPVQITSLGDGVAALAAGRDHSLAIKNDGTVWAWGYNNYSQLGLGDTTNRVTPVQVTVLGNNVAALTAGGWHTLALKGDGTVWSWGLNSSGQLGLGNTTSCSSPVQVASLGNSVAALATGGEHSFAIKNDGTVWAWGLNGSGQLGLGDTTNRLTPVQVTNLGSNVAALTAGGWHSLALKGDGTVWSWGLNGSGQLGLGDATYRSSPVQVNILGNNVAALTAGGWHTLALKGDGTVWAWGRNSDGQLGLGDTAVRSSPVQLSLNLNP
ncbi:MAG: hypothetical protein WCP58_05955, partial [bacterium]